MAGDNDALLGCPVLVLGKGVEGQVAEDKPLPLPSTLAFNEQVPTSLAVLIPRLDLHMGVGGAGGRSRRGEKERSGRRKGEGRERGEEMKGARGGEGQWSNETQRSEKEERKGRWVRDCRGATSDISLVHTGLV